MKTLLYALFSCLLVQAVVQAQPLVQAGEAFPNYLLRPVINAPSPQVDVWAIKGKYIILNHWGTWCTPCIPEMEALAKLQKQYAGRVQIIGVSNDPVSKLQAYLKKRPTPIWLASDTASNLYRQAGFKYVGQAIVLNPEKKVVALVHSDSITGPWMERLLRTGTAASNAEITGAKPLTNGDPFGVDSSLAMSIAVRGYMPSKPSMSLSYKGSALEGRRLTFYNVCPTSLYREAYDISSPAQLVYEVEEKKLCDWDNKATLLCFDLLVQPTQTDSLKELFKQGLARLLPYKTRVEQRELPVFVLLRDSSGRQPSVSTETKADYSYSGNGFSGKGVPMQVFAQYLTNEAGRRRPVVDETGLTATYDIETKLTLRSREEVLASLKPLGLQLQKTTRKLPVLVIGE